MTKKELMRILRNICNHYEYTIIKPTMYINLVNGHMGCDVYEKDYGLIYHLHVDTAAKMFCRQMYSLVTVHKISTFPLDNFI